jgi:hypothetical protein
VTMGRRAMIQSVVAFNAVCT